MAVLGGGHREAIQAHMSAVPDLDHLHGVFGRNDVFARDAVARHGAGPDRGQETVHRFLDAGRSIDLQFAGHLVLMAESQNREQAARVVEVQMADEYRL